MAEMMEDVMDLVYEHLSPAEIDAHYEEIVHLPDVLMAREDDTLEGITIGRLVSGNGIDLRKHGIEPEPKLLIATKFRVVLPRISTWGVRGILNAPYSEIVTVNYTNGRLKVRKIGEDTEFELCSEKSPKHFLNALHQRVSVRYNEIMKKVMSVALKQLSSSDITDRRKEIMYLPEVLMSRDAIETLEGMLRIFSSQWSEWGLLIATDIRLMEVIVQDEKAKVSWDVLYSEIETVNYYHDDHGIIRYGRLEVRKKKGWTKTTSFTLPRLKSNNPSEFLDVLRRHIPVFVDGSPLAEFSNKAIVIDRALWNMSILETGSLSRKDLFNTLCDVLREDELPEAIVSGSYHNGRGILVATDRRIVFVNNGLVGIHLYLEDISSIDETPQGPSLDNISIYACGSNERIDYVNKNMARRFADFLRNKLDIHDAVLEQDTSAADEQPKEEQQNSPPVVQSNVSVADELRKFAELRDLGIITDEEFEAQKAKLLGM